MKLHYQIKTERETATHFGGIFDDHTLCGVSIHTTTDSSIGKAKHVKTKVTCKDCIRIVKYCQSVYASEFQHV